MRTEAVNNQLLDIALRIREMREIFGFSTAEMAKRTDISEDLYIQYEAGRLDLPFTFMHKCAMAFGVELTVLLEGQTAKLSSYAVTRKSQGPVTASEDGITIQSMAALFRQKLATPYWVTYEYSEALQHEPIHTTTHAGQEFDLVIKGTLKVRVGDHVEVLHEGDSIFYNSSTPHGMIAAEGADCVFLAMVMATNETDTQITPTPQKVKQPEPPLLCSKFIQTEEDENGALQSISFPNSDAFNFAFDVVDGIARRETDKVAMIH
ncbi:MAG: cupin domain-containing protein, partial [Ruminococcaceae bacterium]|nr:cupin domain-containing protein [Oscillospiraceae bacterium]